MTMLRNYPTLQDKMYAAWPPYLKFMNHKVLAEFHVCKAILRNIAPSNRLRRYETLTWPPCHVYPKSNRVPGLGVQLSR